MTILRPVTQRLPHSITISEQSNLPFSCVITPYGDNTLLKPSNSSTDRKGDEEEKVEVTSPAPRSTTTLLPADSIPKCGNCGAPLNPCSPVRSYPSKPTSTKQLHGGANSNNPNNEYPDNGTEEEDVDELESEEFEAGAYGSFVCGLCGNTTSFHPLIQAPLHPTHMGNELYTSRFQNNAHQVQMALREYEEQYMKKGSSWRFNNSRVFSSNSRHHPDKANAFIEKYLKSQQLYPECHNHLMEYSVPHFSSNQIEMDAEDCPPILTLLLLDYGPTMDIPNYYPSICQSIRHLLQNAPPHAKVGIFLASYTHLTIFDLASPTPHLKHIPLPSPSSSFSEEFGLQHDIDWNHCYVSCTPQHLPNIESVLRALEDSLVLNSAIRPHGYHSTSSQKLHTPNLGNVLHHLLYYFEACGRHPGDGTTSAFSSSDHPVQEESSFYFAGGKIMIFLPQAPSEIGEVVVENGGYVGTGGYGGSCARVGQRFSSIPSEADEKDLAEKEEEQIMAEFMDYFLREKADVADWYWDLGGRAAGLAMGIELFGIQSEENTLETKSFGFPLMKLLSERSGGCGPLIFCLNQEGDSNENKFDKEETKEEGDSGTLMALFNEVEARCPWNRPCAFGAMLRIRTSSSFAIDISPPTDHAQQQQQSRKSSSEKEGGETSVSSTLALNRYHKTGGMVGSCIANPLESDLWHFGTCDLDTTLAFDLEIVASNGVLGDKVIGNDGEIIKMPPCIQTCFMYTAVIPAAKEKEGGETNHDHEEEIESISFKTVRRLRVLTTNLNVAENTEQLTMSMDAEALAVVLFHKMISSSLSVGLRETRILGQNWLLAALLSTYRSAERYYKEQRSRRYDVLTDNTPFYTNERLLSEQYPDTKNSDLSTRDILLGEGHELIAALPLMLFSLLNCDAIRPATNTGFTPSLDSRIAAIANMSIMSPSVLSRAIAPRLELWSEDGNVQHMDSIRMNRTALENLLQEEDEKSILFLDSPWLIMLYRTGNGDSHDEDGSNGVDHHRRRQPRYERKIPPVGALLLQAVEDASKSYRVTPPIHMALENDDDEEKMVSSWERFRDALLEDLDDIDTEDGNEEENAFEIWCNKIANTLYE